MIFEVARTLSHFVYALLDIFQICSRPLVFVWIALTLHFYFDLSAQQSLVCVLLLYLVTGGWRFARVIYWTLGRDFRALVYLLDVQSRMRRYEQTGETIVSLFQKTARNHPQKTALVLVDEKQWTFREMDELSNAIANLFYECGYRKGDVVALFMESRPEFIMIWLGLAKIGVVTAFINFNLRMEVLAHSISASDAKALIFSTELTEAIHDVKPMLPANLALYCRCGDHCQTNGLQVIHLEQVLSKMPTHPPPKDNAMLFSDKLFYIYTSGTTGVPKAAIVSQSRFFYMSNTIYHFFKLTPDDIIYNTLPLYHVAAGVLGVGQCLLKGCTLVIRKKFSASRFWDDCCAHNCTAAQYIGEICRYLLATPKKPAETQHKIRVMFGNGLRPAIWNEFRQRFGIERIGEFYGATEGNANIINADNVRGAVGFQSRILPFVYPVVLVKVDEITGELVRNRRGLCIRCEPGEPGELVGKIVKGSPLRNFDGYVNKDSTVKKMAFDVFRKGDCYFLTGDILEMDEYGYMYFRDRTGDTFRWRGENVSTSEVEAVISNVTHLKDTVVYGVEVPGNEGRAGMAAIADEHFELNLVTLNHDMQKSLPSYARPIFLRLLDSLDMTETFKLKKTTCKMEGYNPSVVRDRLYYLDPKVGEYQILDVKVYEDICSGRIRF